MNFEPDERKEVEKTLFGYYIGQLHRIVLRSQAIFARTTLAAMGIFFVGLGVSIWILPESRWVVWIFWAVMVVVLEIGRRYSRRQFEKLPTSEQIKEQIEEIGSLKNRNEREQLLRQLCQR